ncbi:MAG TPA: hypothetical protein VG167_18760 [Verrucomicrobiae bacterium]|nr:hypothetical protein [Verrucomicrobiae bacterium]
MPAILKIGYTKFLMRNEAAAAAALKSLTGAVKVKREYSSGDHCDVYRLPDDDDPGDELGIEIVKSSQVRLQRPVFDLIDGHVQPKSGPKQAPLNGREQRLLPYKAS